MAGKLGMYEVQHAPQAWAGMTSKNNLGAIAAKNPKAGSIAIIQLMAHNRGKSFESILSELKTREFDTSDEYTWQVMGNERRNITLLEARTEDGTTVTPNMMVGANVAPFYLVFGEDWFFDGEVIVGNLNEVYQFRILGNPIQEGLNTVYKVELMGGNTDGVPGERLQAGEQFSYETAPVEFGLSREVGGVRFAAPFTMRNEWSAVRIRHKADGDMLGEKLAVGIPFEKEINGKVQKQVVDLWMHYEDYKVEKTFSDYKNNALMFGRSNRDKNGEYRNIGKSGGVIKTGAGLLAQMEVANTIWYSTFSLQLIEDALYDLSTSRLDFGDRTFIIRTGEMGAKLFHKAVAREVNGWTQIKLDNSSINAVKKVQSKLHDNALGAGYQFTEWYAPNGVKVKLQVDHWYDDDQRNKIRHPLGGFAQSYRFDILHIGSEDNPNMFKCTIKNRPELRGYQSGFRNAFTNEYGNDHMSWDEDSTVIHKFAMLGVCVLDPTRTISIIPNILK